MNYLKYLPFILLIAIAYIYYYSKKIKLEQLYKNKRRKYSIENPDLAKEQSESLSKGYPWIGIESETVLELFGEPSKKRILNDSQTRAIWIYRKFFIYLDENIITQCKKR